MLFYQILSCICMIYTFNFLPYVNLDDPTVLSDVESQLELNVMRESRDENTRSAPNQESGAKAKARPTSKTAVKTADVNDANVDKENIPPAKRQKFNGKSDKTTTKKKEKSKKHLKAKKVSLILTLHVRLLRSFVAIILSIYNCNQIISIFSNIFFSFYPRVSLYSLIIYNNCAICVCKTSVKNYVVDNNY